MVSLYRLNREFGMAQPSKKLCDQLAELIGRDGGSAKAVTKQSNGFSASFTSVSDNLKIYSQNSVYDLPVNNALGSS